MAKRWYICDYIKDLEIGRLSRKIQCNDKVLTTEGRRGVRKIRVREEDINNGHIAKVV